MIKTLGELLFDSLVASAEGKGIRSNTPWVRRFSDLDKVFQIHYEDAAARNLDAVVKNTKAILEENDRKLNRIKAGDWVRFVNGFFVPFIAEQVHIDSNHKGSMWEIRLATLDEIVNAAKEEAARRAGKTRWDI